jgi:hypothetical protein
MGFCRVPLEASWMYLPPCSPRLTIPSLLDAYKRNKERKGSLTCFQEEGEAIGGGHASQKHSPGSENQHPLHTTITRDQIRTRMQLKLSPQFFRMTQNFQISVRTLFILKSSNISSHGFVSYVEVRSRIPLIFFGHDLGQNLFFVNAPLIWYIPDLSEAGSLPIGYI